MKLVLLGTTGYHPNRRRHTACMFLPEVGVTIGFEEMVLENRRPI